MDPFDVVIYSDPFCGLWVKGEETYTLDLMVDVSTVAYIILRNTFNVQNFNLHR